MGQRLRHIVQAFVVAPPTGARIRDRLHVSREDAHVLKRIGEHLGHLAGLDLAERVRLGGGPKHKNRAERKQGLTGACSSRWAGTITRTTADQWERGWKNLLDERATLRAGIRTITQRLVIPIGTREGKVRGYPTRAERWEKQRRLHVLKARLERVEKHLQDRHIPMVRGGRRLAHARHHLTAAGMSLPEWRARWDAARLFLSADGEADKAWGNETIRVHPEEHWMEVRLPTPLAHLSNTPGRAPTYRLACQVKFNHRADEWAAQAATGAIRYDITHDPKRNRWYLDASWSVKKQEPISVEELRARRTLGVDVNADHLACWVIDPDGNPVGSGYVIPLKLNGKTTRRDGLLRAAISRLLQIATEHDCGSVSIEDLNFTDARMVGRETMGRGPRGKRFRRTVSAIPTSRFRQRLVGMAHNHGLSIIAVDPAYTSRWGAQHWQKPLNQSHRKNSSDPVSRHESAAVVIGRRSLGHHARRRTEKTRLLQRKLTGKPSSRPRARLEAGRNATLRKDPPHQHPLGKTVIADRACVVNQAAQDRSGPPTMHDLLLHSD